METGDIIMIGISVWIISSIASIAYYCEYRDRQELSSFIASLTPIINSIIVITVVVKSIIKEFKMLKNDL